MIYQFDDDEIEYYRRMAEKRCLPKREAGVVDRLVAKHLDRIENDLLGLLGEAAVGEFLNIGVNTHDGLHGDGGVADFEYGGFTVQVKATKHSDGGLLFQSRNHFKADVAILAIVDRKVRGRVALAGWVDRGYFLKHHTNRDLGYGKCAYMPQKDLFPIETFHYDCPMVERNV